MANPDHVSLARAGSEAIARWREITFRSPNTRLTRFDLGYRLEDRAASETFTPEFNYGRPSLDLSGSFLSGIKLPSADLRHDDLSGADLTSADLRLSDMSGANLTGAHLFRAIMPSVTLTGAQLSGCSLGRARLSRAVMVEVVLRGADLSYADLSYADLESADLSGADLTATNLAWASMTNANLRGATISVASLMMANLTGADLRGARLVRCGLESAILHRATAGGTLFANCDLRSIIGLDTMLHSAPSAITLDTVAQSGGRIPRQFLQGAGVAEPLIAAQDVLVSERRTYPTVLLVCSRADAELAERLRSELGDAHIPCWSMYADDENSLNTGEVSLDHVVFYDRLVLVCSDDSLGSPLTSRYFSELLRASDYGASGALVSLGAGDVFYERRDRLCAKLREGETVDMRPDTCGDSTERAVAELVRALTSPTF